MEKYGSGTPEDWVEKKIYTPHSGLGIYLMMVVNLILFGPIGLTIWAVQMAWIPITAAGIINGIGHYWGYRNFACEDASTNVIPWGILIGGEELHNNHHAYGSSAKLSNKWYEFDIGWLYIRSMEIVGLAKVKKIAPTAKFTVAKQVCDQDLLNAVITHRYDVLTRYASTVKATCGDELAKLQTSLPQLQDNQKIKKLKSWLHLDEADLGDAEKSKLAEVLKQSEQLHTIYTMRQELSQLWVRSNASKEQLLKQLQDWCHRAETSGISSLQTFSHKLRCYA